MLSNSSWNRRGKAAAYHLLLTLGLATLVAVFVLLVWYPYPLWKISGGIELLGLLVVCDLVLGPLFTLIVFNPKKSKRELWMDMSLIALTQLAALIFGLWTVVQARPIYLVFERDLYRVVRAVDIPEANLAEIPEQFRQFPLSGPRLISVRSFWGLSEQLTATTAELEGQPLGAQPKFWTNYDPIALNVSSKGKPLSLFKSQFASEWSAVEKILSDNALFDSEIVFYPFVEKSHYWTVFIRKSDGLPVGFLPVDPYGP